MNFGIGRFVTAASVNIQKLLFLFEAKLGAIRPAFAIGIA